MPRETLFELTTCPGWDYFVRGAAHPRGLHRIKYPDLYAFVDRWVIANLADKYTAETQPDWTWDLYDQATYFVHEECMKIIDSTIFNKEHPSYDESRDLDEVYSGCLEFLPAVCLHLLDEQIKDKQGGLDLINQLFYKQDHEMLLNRRYKQ